MSLKVDPLRIVPTPNLGPSKPLAPKSNKTAEVAPGIFKKIKNGITSATQSIGNFVDNVEQSALSKIIDLCAPQITESEAFLSALTKTDVVLVLSQVTDKLPMAIEKFIGEGFLQQFSQNKGDSTKKLGELISIHIIASFAAHAYPDAKKEFSATKSISNTVKPEEFFVKAIDDLIKLFAKEFNHIDAAVSNGVRVTPELFNDLADQLLTRMGLKSIDSALRTFKIFDLKKTVCLGLMQAYAPFGIWLAGGEFHLSQSSDFQDFMPILERLGAYAADCLAKDCAEKDSALLRQLTGVDDVQELIHILAPKLLHGILSNETINQFLETLSFDALGVLKRNEKTAADVSSAVTLKIVANVARDIFAEEIASGTQITYEDFVLKTCMGISNIFGSYLQDIKKHPENQPLSEEQFRPLAKRLLMILAPKDATIQSFIKRRKTRLTGELAKLLKKSYESIALRNDARIYKQKLREILWNPVEMSKVTSEPLPAIPTKKLFKVLGMEKLVQQIYNACFNVMDIGRAFVADKFSNPDVVVNQMRATFNPVRLPTSLLPNLAQAIYQRLQDPVESPINLYNSLRELFTAKVIENVLLEDVVVSVFSNRFPSSAMIKQQLQEGFSSLNLSDEILSDLSEEIRAGLKIPSNSFDKLYHHLKTSFSQRCSDELLREISAKMLEDKALDKEAICRLLQEEFNKENIPEKLFPGIARGISKLIQINHKISEPEIIYKHLRTKFTKEDLDDVAADKIAKNVITFVQSRKKSDSLSSLVDHLEKDPSLNITKVNLTLIAQEVFILINPSNPLYWMTPAIQNALHLTLFKLLVNLFGKVAPENRTMEKLFPAALQILFDTTAQELPVIIAGIKNIQDPNHQAIMQPFVDKLIRLFFEDEENALEDHLPIFDELKPLVANLIRDNAYKLILPIIEATTSCIDAKAENKARLDGVYGNTHVSDASLILGSFAAASIPFHLQESHELFAAMAVDIFSPLLASQSGKEPSKKKRKLKHMISATLEDLSKNQTESMKSIYVFIQDFCEAALLNYFANVSEDLAESDERSKDNPKGTLSVQGVTIGAREVKDHLSLIAAIKKKKKYKSRKIPLNVMMREFHKAGKLHSALRGKKDEFFEKLSLKLFEILKVNRDAKLPLPHFLKGPIWDVFETHLMPLILLKLFEKLTTAHTLNLILGNLFEQINAETDDAETTTAMPEYTDEPQKKLNKIFSELARALVEMQESVLTRVVFSKKVEELAGAAMGNPTRHAVQTKNVLKIIDDLIVNLLPNLHPGYLNGKFIVPELNFSHILPRTKEEKVKYQEELAKAEKLAKTKVVEEITHTIENQVHYLMLKSFRKLWNHFRAFLNLILDRIDRSSNKKHKLKINHGLDVAAHYFIKPILILLTFPILHVVEKLLRFYFVKKGMHLAKDVYQIHSNIFFEVVTQLMDFIGMAISSSEEFTEDTSECSSLA